MKRFLGLMVALFLLCGLVYGSSGTITVAHTEADLATVEAAHTAADQRHADMDRGALVSEAIAKHSDAVWVMGPGDLAQANEMLDDLNDAVDAWDTHNTSVIAAWDSSVDSAAPTLYQKRTDYYTTYYFSPYYYSPTDVQNALEDWHDYQWDVFMAGIDSYNVAMNFGDPKVEDVEDAAIALRDFCNLFL